jgi:hypothetical protein
MGRPATLRRRTVLKSALASPFLMAAGEASTPFAQTPLAQTQGRPQVDLLLVLAVDVSGSVDESRFQLQKHGYAAAFRSADVIQTIQSGAAQSIAVAMMQWTGPDMQAVVAGWTQVRDAASAGAFAAAVDASERMLFAGGTSISGALDRATTLLAEAPFTAPRKVIDVSGDGANNRGRPAELARDAAVSAGIVINGLPILALEPDLDKYYQDSVIGGPGAFVITIQNYDQFAEAIERKLISEIAAIGPARRRLGQE